jgi:plastocyanin
VLALLAGCSDGGGGDSDGGQKTGVVSVGAGQPIAFGADEYSFEPRAIVVKSGTKEPGLVRFVLRNNGSLAHDLHVTTDGGKDLGGTPIFGPGKTESGQAMLAPGKYRFICTVGDHANLGMKGTLTVTSEKVERPADPDAGQEGEGEKEREGG